MMKRELCVIVIIICAFNRVISQIEQKTFYEPVAYVAGIFDEKAEVEHLAFNSSIKRAHNEEAAVQFQFRPTTRTEYAVNSFSVWKKACTLDIKPVAVFGPQVPGMDGAIRQACASAHIPHLQATWESPEPEINPDDDPCAEVVDACSQENVEKDSRCCFVSLNFYPDADEVSQAMAQVLINYGWTTFTILYEDTYGLMRVQKLLSTFAALSPASYDTAPLIVRRLQPGSNNQHIFKELDVMHESRVLLDCHVERVVSYLDDAAAAGMLNDYQAYILMTLEAHSISKELVDMTALRANVSWLNMMELEARMGPDDPLKDKAKAWYPHEMPPTTKIRLETLLIADVANHLAVTMGDLKDLDVLSSVCLSEGETPWSLGATLQLGLIATKSTGYSGNVEFNDHGKRVNYTLHVNEMVLGDNPGTVTSWDSATAKMARRKEPNEAAMTVASSAAARNKIFKVISRVAKPYFWNKTAEPGEVLTGNDRYEGFSVDMITEIFKVIKNTSNGLRDFQFIFVEPTSEAMNTQGTHDPKTKQWSGLIGELLGKRVDLAICDLTITEERKSVVDFSVPFMTLGISILFTKEHQIQPGRFSFLNPYSIEVWIYTATAYLVVSIVLFVCSRISPGDWENPQPCEKEPEELENIWNFKNCTWLTMGSIMTQGCDILPKAVGSRWVCGMWWFFAMIVCQTYIAQLAASLTSALEDEPINNVEDLAHQKKISYGCQEGGSTAQFFARSKDKMFEQMWMKMNSSRPSTLCENNEQGAHRVLKGKNRYAFFMESTTIEYMAKRNCELTQIGNLLDSKDYGIAMPSNSPFRTPINQAILAMKESGKLEAIKRVWWEEKYNATKCAEERDKNDFEGDLEMDNLIGAFLVLGVGCVLSVIVAAFEFLDHIRNVVISERITHKEAFWKELKSSLNLLQLQKPVLRCSHSPSEETSPPDLAAAPKIRPMHLAAANFINLEKML